MTIVTTTTADHRVEATILTILTGEEVDLFLQNLWETERPGI
jgi:hypothetical protein